MPDRKNTNTGSAPQLTTALGMQDWQLIEKMATFNRERIPERSAVDHHRSRAEH